MYHAPYGPRGAESEQDDFWTDIVEGGDMLPGMVPGMMPGHPNQKTTDEEEEEQQPSTAENREWFEMSEQPEDNDL